MQFWDLWPFDNKYYELITCLLKNILQIRNLWYNIHAGYMYIRINQREKPEISEFIIFENTDNRI